MHFVSGIIKTALQYTSTANRHFFSAFLEVMLKLFLAYKIDFKKSHRRKSLFNKSCVYLISCVAQQEWFERTMGWEILFWANHTLIL